MTFDFSLIAVFITSLSSKGVWTPNIDATVLAVATLNAILISKSPTNSYPTATLDNCLFISHADGVYDCAFEVQSNSPIYIDSQGVNKPTAVLFYVPKVQDSTIQRGQGVIPPPPL